MTPASFEFKLAIAFGTYKSVYKISPTRIITHKKEFDMLKDANLIDFEHTGSAYKGTRIMYRSHSMHCNFVELGQSHNKLEF